MHALGPMNVPLKSNSADACNGRTLTLSSLPQGYCLLLFDCDVSLLGLGYLLLLAGLMLLQPPRGRWLDAGGSGSTSGTLEAVMQGMAPRGGQSGSVSVCAAQCGWEGA